VRGGGISWRSRKERLRSAPQSNALLPLAQVDFGQIVLFHELDEPANFFDVENVAAAWRGI
jgi:hypothetical protein